jgi:hypothetical protein
MVSSAACARTRLRRAFTENGPHNASEDARDIPPAIWRTNEYAAALLSKNKLFNFTRPRNDVVSSRGEAVFLFVLLVRAMSAFGP